MPFSMVNQIYLQDIKSYGNNFHVPHDRICLLSYGQILQDVNQTARPLIQILLTGLGFFLPEISPLSEKNPSLQGWACRRRDSSLWEHLSLHALKILGPRSAAEHIFFLHSSKKMAVWPEDNLLCILSSSEFLPWEPQKRLKHEKVPVCRSPLRFKCTSRDPQIPPFSSHLKSSAYVKKISFSCLLGGGGKEKII